MKYCIVVSMLCILTPHWAVAQWEPDVRLTNDGAESYTSFPDGRCLAASGNVLHAVWYDYRDGSGDIYYKRSQDNGTSWGPDTRLTTPGTAPKLRPWRPPAMSCMWPG